MHLARILCIISWQGARGFSAPTQLSSRTAGYHSTPQQCRDTTVITYSTVTITKHGARTHTYVPLLPKHDGAGAAQCTLWCRSTATVKQPLRQLQHAAVAVNSPAAHCCCCSRQCGAPGSTQLQQRQHISHFHIFEDSTTTRAVNLCVASKLPPTIARPMNQGVCVALCRTVPQVLQHPAKPQPRAAASPELWSKQ